MLRRSGAKAVNESLVSFRNLTYVNDSFPSNRKTFNKEIIFTFSVVQRSVTKFDAIIVY